jgi:hypothetical protein
LVPVSEELQQVAHVAEGTEETDISILSNAETETPEYADEAEDSDSDRSLEAPAESADPVSTYFREMGRTPLLTRDGEVRLAKRIERGQLRALKALSRSPIVWVELVRAATGLRHGERSIEEIVDVGDEPLAPAQREKLTRELLRITGQIAILHKSVSRASNRPLRMAKSNKAVASRIRYRLAHVHRDFASGSRDQVEPGRKGEPHCKSARGP